MYLLECCTCLSKGPGSLACTWVPDQRMMCLHKSLRGRSSLFVCSLVKGNRTVLVNKVFAVFDGLIPVGYLRYGLQGSLFFLNAASIAIIVPV